jgi:hypothetical protein
MKENYNLPSATGQDFPEDLRKRKAKKAKKVEKCYGTNACDCKRCGS